MTTSASESIRVLLADDHAIVRKGLREFLEEDGEVTVVTEAAGGAEAVRLAGELRPAVAVLDVQMPGVNGIEATRQIKAAYPVENPFPRTGPDMAVTLKPSQWHTVTDAMIDVVHSQRGTAKLIAPGLNYLVAAKTGTAQVFTVGQNQDYKRMHVGKSLRDHALFVAFAPADDPRIAIAVIAEHGGHGGSVAAPIARAVIEQYLKQ